jgi:hypothetical protein
MWMISWTLLLCSIRLLLVFSSLTLLTRSRLFPWPPVQQLLSLIAEWIETLSAGLS